MKKLYLRIAVALVGFAGLGITAKAQAVDQVVLTVPFEFVISGETLPAGTYRVNRLRDIDSRLLVLSSFENRVTVTVLPTEVESVRADKGQVTFEVAGSEHFLSTIQTPDHKFSIPVSRKAILLASGKSQPGTDSGSASGSN